MLGSDHPSYALVIIAACLLAIGEYDSGARQRDSIAHLLIDITAVEVIGKLFAFVSLDHNPATPNGPREQWCHVYRFQTQRAANRARHITLQIRQQGLERVRSAKRTGQLTPLQAAACDEARRRIRKHRELFLHEMNPSLSIGLTFGETTARGAEVIGAVGQSSQLDIASGDVLVGLHSATGQHYTGAELDASVIATHFGEPTGVHEVLSIEVQTPPAAVGATGRPSLPIPSEPSTIERDAGAPAGTVLYGSIDEPAASPGKVVYASPEEDYALPGKVIRQAASEDGSPGKVVYASPEED